MAAPTHFLQDIFRQPAELQRTIDYLAGSGQNALQLAEVEIRKAQHVFVTGIGASWHAAIAAGSLFHLAGRPVYMREAGELLHFSEIPRGAVMVAVSRSGRSIEIVQLLAKAHESGATVIGITNSPESPLAQETAVPIVIPVKLDHAISVNTYSTLTVAMGALASSATTGFRFVAPALSHTIREAGLRMEIWRKQLLESTWLASERPYYFLARGTSLGSCHEARLLWEEGVKMPATAMSTGGFRHGPQEIVTEGMRFCMWIDASQMRDQDLAVAGDLRRLGACVMLIGENLPGDAGDLVCQLPPSPAHWQFVIDVIPAQLAAERLAWLAGVDCDSLRVCSFVVEDEHGLLRKKAEVPQDAD